MTVSDILSIWREAVPTGWDATCDRLHYGDPEGPADRIAVCFRITLANLREAISWGADMIITHEPLYPAYDAAMAEGETDPVVQAMHGEITRAELAILRIHDHAHLFEGDFIHMGFLRATGLGEYVRSQSVVRTGFRLLELSKPLTPRQIGEMARDRMGVPHPRIAGSADTPVTRVLLAPGSIGNLGQPCLADGTAELLITGELDELGTALYAADAVSLGKTCAVLALGHGESERVGMASIADWLSWILPDVKTQYFPTADTYQYL